MIITCPDCATSYRLDPEALGAGGRKVRCAQCGRVWFQAAAEAPSIGREPALETAAASGSAVLSAAAPARAALRRRGVPATGIALVSVLVATIGIAILGHETIESRFPAMAALYDWLGMTGTAPSSGLRIDKLAPKRVKEGLAVEGEITNMSDEARSIPKLIVILEDAQGRAVRTSSFALTEAPLLPGAIRPFRLVLPKPGDDATRILVRMSEAP
jgi:predicted Zn finger-like uncharacterized protein